MASKSKSIIPLRAQIPAAVIGAIILTLLLIRQFGPGQNEKGQPLNQAEASTTDSAVPMVELESLLADVHANYVERVERTKHLPPLSGNPFRLPGIPEDGLPSNEDGVIEGSLAIEPDVPTRDEILASMILTGSCVVGETSMAIVNGQYFKAGERIGSFVVWEVRERELVIADGEGIEVLRMAEPDWLDVLGGKEPLL